MATKQSNVVELKQLRIEQRVLSLWGESPLIMHAWSQKAKQQMLDKQMKLATTGKEAKDPQADFEQSIYLAADGLPGFPAVAFKAAAVDAAIAMDFKKTNLRQSFHINADMIAVLGDPPTAREDMVRVGMGSADIRYRAQFTRWGVQLPITLNVGLLSWEQIVNLFNAAGFGIGIGEWRPQRDGQFGRFRLATAAEERELQELAAARRKMTRTKAA
jgi:hypothetical protein